MGAPNSPTTDVAPPVERRNLTYAGTCTERGKPVGLPCPSTQSADQKTGRARESEPQGEPMGLRAEDGGKSECLPVTGRIGIAPSGIDREWNSKATSSHAKAG